MTAKYYYNDEFTRKRLELVESLRRKGIDDKVADAIAKLPREKFVAPSYVNRAYEDTALPIECDQTISQPYTVAYMTGLLDVEPDDKILEIGAGSGYQAALLYVMGAKVFTVERVQGLYDRARKIFNELGMNINIRLGDGSLGWRQFAPYDGILVTAAAPKAPNTLLQQLKVGGRLVIPIGDRGAQRMHLIQRVNDKDFKEYKFDSFKFVPLIGKEAWNEE